MHSKFETEPYLKGFSALGSFLCIFISVYWRRMIDSVQTECFLAPGNGVYLWDGRSSMRKTHRQLTIRSEDIFHFLIVVDAYVSCTKRNYGDKKKKTRERSVQRRGGRITGEKPEQDEGEILYLLEWVRHRESNRQGFSINSEESNLRT